MHIDCSSLRTHVAHVLSTIGSKIQSLGSTVATLFLRTLKALYHLPACALKTLRGRNITQITPPPADPVHETQLRSIAKEKQAPVQNDTSIKNIVALAIAIGFGTAVGAAATHYTEPSQKPQTPPEPSETSLVVVDTKKPVVPTTSSMHSPIIDPKILAAAAMMPQETKLLLPPYFITTKRPADTNVAAMIAEVIRDTIAPVSGKDDLAASEEVFSHIDAPRPKDDSCRLHAQSLLSETQSIANRHRSYDWKVEKLTSEFSLNQEQVGKMLEHHFNQRKPVRPQAVSDGRILANTLRLANTSPLPTILRRHRSDAWKIAQIKGLLPWHTTATACAVFRQAKLLKI